MRAALLLPLCAFTSACQIENIPFRCEGDPECGDGKCELTGYCSFNDAICAAEGESGYRYGAFAPEEIADRCVPRCVSELALGGLHSCALRGDGSVACWGQAVEGQLGTGLGSDARITSPATVPAIGRATAIAAGGTHTCSIDAVSGSVWCWGGNDQFQLGTKEISAVGPLEVKSTLHPDQDPSVQVAAGVTHTCARGSYGIECWGANGLGQLGTPLVTVLASPVPVKVGGTNLAQPASVALGAQHSCTRLASGKLWCWGSNQAGQQAEPLSTVQERTPKQIDLGGFVSEMALGYFHTCAIVDGLVKCWGADIIAPTDVPLAGTATELCGGVGHGCALLDDGRVQCWGNDDLGQLGPSATTTPSPPVFVELPEVAIAIRCGGAHTCVITERDRVLCWGGNEEGEIGNGESGSSVPNPDGRVTESLCRGL